MKLKNILIVVNDIEISKTFYKDLFGLQVITDFGENVILSEGLVLQERKTWESLIRKEVIQYSNATELYFEEYDLDAFVSKLKSSNYKVNYVDEFEKMKNNTNEDSGKRVIRIYDPDGHIIEVGEVVKV